MYPRIGEKLYIDTLLNIGVSRNIKKYFISIRIMLFIYKTVDI